ncbi:uncharacterized protein MONOS_6877 [Monocercomonoides exilis]|uniref:uncharacterized protein n=1 Tax=Monocercomonoides exilis TaxID=2049356 RepID=UPI00355A16F7|nr:hypothetical protein MONOS_6877 [Monocercomonoides exilis]|eukprot:MONOS_6877.1-p1 / transcript=MONOS_6877.1 / gene=MONOS_6877 / organism=Monocercomonoides_exilis_PA203 / gene_product=unspecified product / transcript_product=unspecified product / location=Mono_scaffold00225:41982-42279(+) / protein_length=77 / sequence_SO=supercontig / SO=protein_coding / is_pseudo=false
MFRGISSSFSSPRVVEGGECEDEKEKGWEAEKGPGNVGNPLVGPPGSATALVSAASPVPRGLLGIIIFRSVIVTDP